MTALMDILSNLLFFLLASYSSQTLELEKKADLHLPTSSSQLALEPTLTLMVTAGEIRVANKFVVGLADNKVKGTVEDDDRIVLLYDRLAAVKAQKEQAGSDYVPGSDVVMLLADRSIDSSVVTWEDCLTVLPLCTLTRLSPW